MPGSASSRSSRPVSTASSLMQDVPGAFPAVPQFGTEDNDEEEAQEPRTLHEVVHSRRAEYVRPRHIRIKVGTWNVAAYKGAEKDVGGWFVQGKGLAERLTGLNINTEEERTPKEDVSEQEERYQSKKSALPAGDQGSLPTLPAGDQSSLPGNEDVGLYVLGLQEVVDISSATEALRPYTDPSVATRWKEAMEAALPAGYKLVAEQQLIGLLLLVYAAPDVAKDVKSVSTTSVGTGLMGYMGNKGAVTARLVLGDTTRLVFVNSHLAAGADRSALERRNWDAQQIVSRTKFEPIQDSMDLVQSQGEQIGDEDLAFWCGDLNYRLEGIPGDDVRRLLMLHTRNEYDLSQRSAQKIEKEIEEATNSVKQRAGETSSSSSSSLRSSTDNRKSTDSTKASTLLDNIAASEDPTSLQTTLSSLLPHDELRQQMQARKAFHDGWQEGPITFLPTYKYDAGTVGVFDSSEKKRAPSWCDRILYRTRREKLAYETKIRDEEKARKMDEQMKASGIDQAGNDDDELLYDYDPETDGADTSGDYDEYDEYDDVQDGVVITKEGFEDAISLEYYTAHQRVLSSDHKPLDASFMLKYDAMVPELKAKIHAEVARELDKAENEGRPNVTVVVDKHHDTPATSEECLPEKFEGIWFGNVRWAQSKRRSLTVANTSRVPTTFSFIQRPANAGEGSGIAPRWLKVEVNGHEMSSSAKASESVTLEPGETGNVDLEMRILSLNDVHDLNDKRELEEILVLRVENGRDHFIPIRGHWLESSLGKSIDKLVRIPEGGIRKLQGQKPEGSKLKVAAKTVAAANNLQETTSKSSNDEEEPVRFSAPRELFRLTEAIEDLSTRVIAEWEMTNTPATPASLPPTASDLFAEFTPEPIPPWDAHPGWPFEKECWAEKDTSHWMDAMSEACNALDDDQALEPSLPDDLPRIQRLYVLCSFLLLFLKSIPDGVITTTLWLEVEKYLAENEKAKRKLSIDDQRTAIQEILSPSPSHSISFVLVMGMLERMITERASAAPPPHPAGSTGGHSRNLSADSTTSQPLSPTRRAGGTLKRIITGKTPSPPPGASKREAACMALATIFADAVVKAPDVSGDKAKTALGRKKVESLEVFLRKDGESG
ncbi:related to inositol polyphosphate 5-phosphatase ocrl-1 [Lecanosticta acicola]|uniref:Related to inositol polyphosphate 5-phosphatase ocrl-1 n=1 Tax=Lecanosticta acicola TaxID=111012 RepID=A0AAI9ECM5_9PEZI|nr:related to inositol polyphosphate 5-phosphatase ocrl-1 [Lecanosticta acicola]